MIDEEAFKAWLTRELGPDMVPGTDVMRLLRGAWRRSAELTAARLVPPASDDDTHEAEAARKAVDALCASFDPITASRAYALELIPADSWDDEAYHEVPTAIALRNVAGAWLAGYGTRLSAPRSELRPHGAPHERLAPDELEAAVRDAHNYAICCTQHEHADVQELHAAYLAGFKGACAYLRAPGVERAEIVPPPTETA